MFPCSKMQIQALRFRRQLSNECLNSQVNLQVKVISAWSKQLCYHWIQMFTHKKYIPLHCLHLTKAKAFWNKIGLYSPYIYNLIYILDSRRNTALGSGSWDHLVHFCFWQVSLNHFKHMANYFRTCVKQSCLGACSNGVSVHKPVEPYCLIWLVKGVS